VTALSRSAEIARQNAAVAVVKAGEVVRLWKSDRNARIELIATAEENGAVGSRVRVRLTTRRETNGLTDAPQYLAGIVRGPADVEIEP
jgi:flagella basal body P-ring formation protein FlgA